MNWQLKLLFTLFSGILITSHASARCRGEGMAVFPYKGSIKPNSLFIISGRANSQEVITSLNQDYPVYLKTEGHTVKLKVILLQKSRHSTTQAILQAEESLVSGKTYSLQINGLDEYQEKILYEYYTRTNKEAKISWTVKGVPDTLKPLSLAEPTFIDKSASYLSCGSSAYANFKITAQDPSSLWVETEMVEIATGKTQVYYIPLGDDEIASVGHSMCEGEFGFSATGMYQVRFKPMDICGNKSNNWSAWQEFSSPFEEIGERPYWFF